MKEKIEEKISEILREPDRTAFVVNYEKVKKLYTLIQKERKEAVEGLLNKCCNKCRDLLYSNYALQGQEKKKRSVEKLVREK